MITWPAILKFEGDNELTFVSGQTEWNADTELHLFNYELDDRLIDSAGAVYSLPNENNMVTPRATGEYLSQQQVAELVMAYMSAMGACCVSKLSALPIKQAVELVGISNEQ